MTLTQITTGGVDENINIDSNTLKVDGTNNRVGIGTASPNRNLHVKTTGFVATSIEKTDGNTSCLILSADDNITSVYSRATDVSSTARAFRIISGGSESLRIDSSGRVGIGHQSPSDPLHVKGASGIQFSIDTPSGGQYTQMSFRNDGTQKAALWWNNTSSSFENYVASGAFKWNIGSEKMRLDSSGRLLVGTSSSRSVASFNSYLQVEGTAAEAAALSVTRNAASAAPPRLVFGKSRGTSVGSSTVVQSGDSLGEIRFAGADGTDINSQAASILCSVDTTPGSNDMPGRLVFSTTADGASSPTERMRIDRFGHVDIDSGIIGVATTDNFTLNSKTQPHYGFNLVGTSSNPTAMSGYYGIAFATNGTEQVRITNIGRLLVGSSSGDGKLVVRQSQNTTTTGTFTNPHVKLLCGGTTNNSGFTGIAYPVSTVDNYGWTVGARRVSTSGTDGAFCFRHHNNSASGNERMRITSAGKLLLGAQSAINYTSSNGIEVHSSNSGGTLILRNTSTASGEYWRIGPENNNTLVLYNHNGTGQYMTNGGTAWNSNASDLRVKDVVGDLNQTTSWNVLKGLQIKEWWFKNESTEHRSENTPHVGPIAQELHALDPNLRLEAPSGTTAATFGQDFDGPVYTYDNDLLLKHALSALNQAIAKIETLEAKVAALEAAE